MPGSGGSWIYSSTHMWTRSAFIESEFDVEVPEADLLSDEFVTIDGMARVVVRLAD